MSNVGVSVGNHIFWVWRALTIVARVVVGLVRPKTIDELDGELTKVIDDFDRAVNVEALRLAKEAGTYSLSPSDDRSCSVVPCRPRAFAWAARIC